MFLKRHVKQYFSGDLTLKRALEIARGMKATRRYVTDLSSENQSGVRKQKGRGKMNGKIETRDKCYRTSAFMKGQNAIIV